jgi:zinc/manganese transport system substrate-binding protein
MRSAPLALLVSAALACVATPAWAMRVVATTPDLAAIAKAVAGPDETVVSLSLPTQDPHFVDARPNLALELSRADALLLVGLDLEVGWLPTLLTGARNSKILPGAPGYIDCSTFPTLLQVPTVAIDRSMGDIHPGGNPHYTHDPRAAALIAKGLAGRFASLEPAKAATFQANADAFAAEIAASTARWTTDAAAVRGTNIVSFHRSYPYLADWLGFTIPVEVEPKPGIPPTPAHVANVMRVASEKGVKLIIQESYYPTTTTQLVASRSGARLVVLPGGTDFDHGQTYVQFVDLLIKKLAGT